MTGRTCRTLYGEPYNVKNSVHLELYSVFTLHSIIEFLFCMPWGGGSGDSCARSHVLDKVGPVHYYHIILGHCLIPHKKICIMPLSLP